MNVFFPIIGFFVRVQLEGPLVLPRRGRPPDDGQEQDEELGVRDADVPRRVDSSGRSRCPSHAVAHCATHTHVRLCICLRIVNRAFENKTSDETY